MVRSAKGDKDRVTVLPRNIVQPLKAHLARVKKLHEEDLGAGYGSVYLPYALKTVQTLKSTKQLIEALIERELATPSRKRRALDNTIARLIVHLSPEEQLRYVEDFLRSRRASRRSIALQIITRHFRPNHKALVLNCFDRHHKQQALKVLTRVDADITDIPCHLLENLGDKYEKARVFEKLMTQDHILALELASVYPLAFVWGAGRARCIKTLPVILEILARSNEEDKGLIIWALGRLQANQQLQQLALLYEVDILHFSPLS